MVRYVTHQTFIFLKHVQNVYKYFVNIKKSISGKHWTDALSHSSLTDYSGEFDTALLMNNSCPENRELLSFISKENYLALYQS